MQVASLSFSEQQTASIVAALKSCGRSRDLHRGRELHAQLLRRHSSSKASLILANALIDMYSKCGSVAEAHHVFSAIEDRCSVVSWNTLVAGYTSNGHGEVALEIFSAMPVINARSCISALEAIKLLAAGEEGHRVKLGLDGHEVFVRMVALERTLALHSRIIDAGFVEANVFVANSLIDCYSRCGSMLDARRVFDRLLLVPGLADVVSWNSIIIGYVHNNQPELALELFDRMSSSSSTIPNARTIVAALNACSSIMAQSSDNRSRSRCMEKATDIHSRASGSSDLPNDVFIQNSLLDLYVKSGDVERAWMIFERMKNPSIVSWNVIILGVAEAGNSPEYAIELLNRMRDQGFVPDSGTLIAALKACSKTGFLNPGKSVVHSLACRAGVDADATLACSLVGHYGRCGSLVAAELAFHACTRPDTAAWSALVGAGDEEHAFQTFHQMLLESIDPDEMTVLSLLSTCSRLGLVERAKKLFREMRIKHCLVPHYTCMVDLLCRANQLEEAMELIEKMPASSKQNQSTIWMTLLSACSSRKNVAIGRKAFDAIQKLDIEERNVFAAAYALMANIYSEACPG